MTSIYVDLENAFRDNPMVVLNQLLLGNLEGVETSHLVGLLVSSATDFQEAIDRAALNWLEANWGQQPSGKQPWVLGAVWERFFLLVWQGDLVLTGSQLDHYFDASFFYLGSMTKGWKLDPLLLYLQAVVYFQIDRSLEEQWKRLAKLPRSIKPRYACLVLAGFMGMQCSHFPEDDGECLEEIIAFATRINCSVARLLKKGCITLEQAEEISSTLVVYFGDKD